MTSSARAPWRRPWPWIAGFTALLVVSLLVPSNPRVVGLWHDDGAYLLLGRNLAEHGVYRDPHLPDPLSIAKYPPGVPLLAAAGWALTRDVAGTTSVLRVLLALAFGATLLVYWNLLRREGGAPARLAPVLVAALAFSPYVLGLVLVPMSEVPSMLATFAALLVYERAARPASLRVLAGVAALVVTALLFRTASITLGAAVVLVLALRREFRASAIFAALVGVPFLALQGFLAVHERPAPGFEDITVYGLPYGRLLRDNLQHLAEYAPQNVAQALGSALWELFPVVFLSGPLPEPAWTVAWVVGLALVAAAVFGVVRDARGGEGPRLRRVYTLLALVLVVLWPFEPARFVLVVLPFLLMDVVRGLEAAFGARSATAFALAALVGAVGSSVPGSFVNTLDAYRPVVVPVELRATVEELPGAVATLPQGAIAASTLDTLLGAHADVRGVWAWDAANVLANNYTVGRSLSRFWFPTDEMARAKVLWRDRDEVRRQFAKVGVDHAVLFPKAGQAQYELQLRSLVKLLNDDGRARLLHRSPSGAIEVWEIRP